MNNGKKIPSLVAFYKLFLSVVKVTILTGIFWWLLDAPSATLGLTPSVFNKRKVLTWYMYQASFIDMGFVVQHLFVAAENFVSGCFWVVFCSEPTQM